MPWWGVSQNAPTSFLNALAMIKVAIFDDHPSVQLGVKSILEQVPDFAVAGPADTADALFRVLSQQMVEVLLLDISMRGQEQAGLQLLPRLRQQFPQLRILMFTMHESGKFIAAANGKEPMDTSSRMRLQRK
jgi:two-component system invasion response regulator UvrY